MAWFAFCKGAACMGNRDAGEIRGYLNHDGTEKRGRSTFLEWWARYGRPDWERATRRATASPSRVAD